LIRLGNIKNKFPLLFSFFLIKYSPVKEGHTGYEKEGQNGGDKNELPKEGKPDHKFPIKISVVKLRSGRPDGRPMAYSGPSWFADG
jgi:hypothetical protein